MLNRRILRIKAFKIIFARAENTALEPREAEAQLDRSCEATRDLYLFLLGVVPALTAEASARIEAARGKFHPTPEELNPNMRFVRNAIAPLLAEDPDFVKISEKKKLSWEQYDVLLRHLYESLRERDYFAEYMNAEASSLKADAALWKKIFENEFEDNAEMEEILEDNTIWWNPADMSYALTWCCRTMDELGKGARWELPPLYMSDLSGSHSESDKAFVVKLLRKAVVNFDEYVSRIAQITPKWDRSRICTTDLALIVAGLAEAECFPAMPKGVIINEYVEISKYYSTPESRAFVNGILDKLIRQMREPSEA